MNIWTVKSIELANKEDYLDRLFEIYPDERDPKRAVGGGTLARAAELFGRREDFLLIDLLLGLERFPFNDPYVSFLRRDRSAMARNPQMVARIAEKIYAMGLDALIQSIEAPKAPLLQSVPKFKRWIGKGALGFPVANDIPAFARSSDDMILNVSGARMKGYAKESLGFRGDRGPDFLARIGKAYVVGEARFLRDFGPRQEARLRDALAALDVPFDSTDDVVPVAILDGVLYSDRNEKMREALGQLDDGKTVLSALLLGEFLRSLR